MRFQVDKHNWRVLVVSGLESGSGSGFGSRVAYGNCCVKTHCWAANFFVRCKMFCGHVSKTLPQCLQNSCVYGFSLGLAATPRLSVAAKLACCLEWASALEAGIFFLQMVQTHICYITGRALSIQVW